jgi:site-specific recombinase XerC
VRERLCVLRQIPAEVDPNPARHRSVKLPALAERDLVLPSAADRQIQELLGHKHLDSTQRYTRVTAHELRSAVKHLRFPRAAPRDRTRIASS